MGIFGRLHRAAARVDEAGAVTKAAQAIAVAPSPAGTSVSLDTTPTHHVLEWAGLPAAAYREAAVRTVVDYIARNIASMPVKVYTRDTDGSRHRVRGTGLARLMERPSTLPGVTRYKWVYSIMCDALLWDRFLCVLGVDRNGDWTLRRVPPRRWAVRGNKLDEITAVRVGLDDRTVEYALPDDRILLMTGFSEAGVNGAPVSGVLAPLLAEARAMADYREAVARSGVQAPAYISRPAGMPWDSDEQRAAFAQMMRSYKAGGGMEGSWPVLDDGMTIKTIDSYKPVDVDDLEARDRIQCMVAEAYHVSPELVGFREGNSASLSELRSQMWSVELMPYIVQLEQVLNADLPRILGEPDAYVELDVDAKMRGTLEEQYQALSTATGRSFLTTNEARERLNLPHVDGGDDLVTPLNVLVGGQPSPQDGGRTQAAQTGDAVL